MKCLQSDVLISNANKLLGYCLNYGITQLLLEDKYAK